MFSESRVKTYGNPALFLSSIALDQGCIFIITTGKFASKISIGMEKVKHKFTYKLIIFTDNAKN